MIFISLNVFSTQWSSSALTFIPHNFCYSQRWCHSPCCLLSLLFSAFIPHDLYCSHDLYYSQHLYRIIFIVLMISSILSVENTRDSILNTYTTCLVLYVRILNMYCIPMISIILNMSSILNMYTAWSLMFSWSLSFSTFTLHYLYHSQHWCHSICCLVSQCVVPCTIGGFYRMDDSLMS